MTKSLYKNLSEVFKEKVLLDYCDMTRDAVAEKHGLSKYMVGRVIKEAEFYKRKPVGISFEKRAGYQNLVDVLEKKEDAKLEEMAEAYLEANLDTERTIDGYKIKEGNLTEDFRESELYSIVGGAQNEQDAIVKISRKIRSLRKKMKHGANRATRELVEKLIESENGVFIKKGGLLSVLEGYRSYQEKNCSNPFWGGIFSKTIKPLIKEKPIDVVQYWIDGGYVGRSESNSGVKKEKIEISKDKIGQWFLGKIGKIGDYRDSWERFVGGSYDNCRLFTTS